MVPESELTVAERLRMAGDYQGALTVLRKVPAYGDRYLRATVELLMGTILVEDLHQFREAIPPLESATQSGEPQIVPRAALTLARALHGLGERGRALALYSEVMERGERVPATAAALDRAQILADQGDYPGAREALRWIVDHGIGVAVANAHRNLGLLEKDAGNPAVALSELRVALDLGLEDGSTAFAAAELLQRGDFPGARTMLVEARGRDFSGELTVQYLLGTMDEREGRIAQALAAYESVWRAEEPDISVEVSDVRGEAALAAGRRHRQDGDTVSARSALARAVEVGADPVAARAHYLLAKRDEADGDPQNAQKHLKLAVRRGDSSTVPEAWLALAHHQERAGEFDAAFRSYESVAAGTVLPMLRGAAIIGKGGVLKQLGRTSEARQAFASVLNIPEATRWHDLARKQLES